MRASIPLLVLLAPLAAGAALAHDAHAECTSDATLFASPLLHLHLSTNRCVGVIAHEPNAVCSGTYPHFHPVAGVHLTYLYGDECYDAVLVSRPVAPALP